METNIPDNLWPHYWGISEDDKVMWTGQVIYSENMDITSTSSFATIGRQSNDYIENISDDVASMFYDERVGILVCDEDDNLYRNGSIVWTEETILWYWVSKGYLYMIDSSEDIHRILLTDVTQSNWDTYALETDNSLPTSSVKHLHIIDLEDVTYIGYEKNLYVINNTSGVVDTTTSYNFLSNDITGITIKGRYFDIYQKDGIVYSWLWINNESSYARNYVNMSVDHAIQVWGTDYIISSNRMYYMNWYVPVSLLYNYYSDELNSDKFGFSRSAISWSGQLLTYLNWVFYILWDDPDLNLWDGNTEYGWPSIISYGKKKNSLPNAINIFNTYASTGEKYQELYSIIKTQSSTSNDDKLYIAYKDTEDNIGVDVIELSDWDYTPNDNKEGIIVYERYDGRTPYQRKQLKKIIISGELGEDDEIDLMYIDTSNRTWNNLVNICTVTWPWKIFERLSDEISAIQFESITFAIRCRQDSTQFKTNSMKYIWLHIEYDNITAENS